MYGLNNQIVDNVAMTVKMREAVIRPYQVQDRDQVRRLCCDNGYLGKPIDEAFTDRDLFAAIFIDPYLDQCPEWTFVATQEGVVVGYLTAAVGMRYFIQQALGGCAALWRLLAIQFSNHGNRANSRFLKWLIFRSWRERVRRPWTTAHMHFCIRRSHRGHFLAQRLWRAFESKLQAHGIDHYYGEVVTTKPEQVALVYRRYGLMLFHQAPSSMFAHIDDRPVWSICIAK